jgi:hypothetical protein
MRFAIRLIGLDNIYFQRHNQIGALWGQGIEYAKNYQSFELALAEAEQLKDLNGESSQFEIVPVPRWAESYKCAALA